MIQLYNTRTQTKEDFKPLHPKEVTMYSCGPTVYLYAHIGNFRSSIMADLLKRVLLFNGYKVKHVINITDVGHLVNEDDSGEDKIEAAAAKEGKTAAEVAKYYFDIFHEEFEKLNLLEPNTWPKASEHIKEQIELIKILEEKGFTYKTSDGIYFDTSKFKDYGKLSNKKVEGLEEGKRITMKEKKNKTDFALWKFSDEKGKRQQEWESPFGLGFPGWHVECSAMSAKYLGEQFDIHTGGEDLAPVHHENEIAQSECAFEKKPSVTTWMHGAFLVVPGGKMSKSKGKIETINDLEKQGISPLAFKYFTYTAHYRKPLTWSKEAITSAVNGYKRLKEIISKLEDDGEVNEKYLKEFECRVNNDLDMPGAVAVLWKLLRDEKASGKVATIETMDEVFGLKLLEKVEIDIPGEIKKLAEERLQARENKEWEKSDELRDLLKEKGWNVKDNKEGYFLEKI